MISGKYYFFWGGECSQWYKAPIKIDGHTYNCNEQYMMAEKARLFNDQDALDAILKISNPRKQKALGRSVKGFDQNEWEKIARLVVYRANLAKFMQNRDLFDFIIGTKDLHIVEASPEDTIWGIGMHETHPDILDETKWKGKNWLGIAIMQARSDIFSMSLAFGISQEDLNEEAEEYYAKHLKKLEIEPKVEYDDRVH